VAGQFVDSFGLSQSQVSRRFQERLKKALETLESRSLKDNDIIALILDGKYLAKHQMVICLGVDTDGRKIPLGFSQGFLCVVDGAKGLYKAIRDVFGKHAVVQRCQWHKRENVVSYLGESDKDAYRGKLQRAWVLPTYADAKEALLQIHGELQQLKRSAARSLMEGLEETLALHRLGVLEELGRTFKTTRAA